MLDLGVDGAQRCLAISTVNFEFKVQKRAEKDAERRRRLRRDAPGRVAINLTGEGLDYVAECGKSGYQCSAWGHVEIGKVEAGCDRATAQSEAFANDASGLQGASGDDPLRALTMQELSAELDALVATRRVDGVQLEACAEVVVPNFVTAHAVKRRDVAGPQHEVNRRRGGASYAEGRIDLGR